jgi:hypothetical protein
MHLANSLIRNMKRIANTNEKQNIPAMIPPLDLKTEARPERSTVFEIFPYKVSK